MEHLLVAFGGLIISFLITYISIPSIVTVAHLKAYYDKPNDRKVHKKAIPSLGGVAVFAGVIIASSIFSIDDSWKEYRHIIAALVILFFIGIKDDILIIAPRTKFMGQLVASVIVVVFTDLRIVSMQGILGVYSIPEIVSVAFSALVVLTIINAYNFIDGIDGLAGSLGVLSSTVFGVWFLLFGNINYAVMAFSLTGGLLGFLRYNLNNNRWKVFMGDTGAMITGFLLAVMLIKFVNLNNDISLPYTVYSAPAIGFGLVIVPVFDLIRIVFIRFFIKSSPSTPDKNHIHHRLLRLKLSHMQSTAILVLVNALFIAFLFIFQRLGSVTLFLLSLLFGMVLSYIPTILNTNRKKKIN